MINGNGITGKELGMIAAAGAAEKWHIPDQETMNKCIAYSKRLQKNHPDWDKFKIARKVAEKFKLTKNN